MERLLRGQARLFGLLVVVLLAVTAVCYAVYAVDSLQVENNVLGQIRSGYNVTTVGPSGPVVSHVRGNNNTTTPLGLLPISSYATFSTASVLIDIIWVFLVLGLTAWVLLRPASKRKDPSRQLDVLYLNLLFGLVFWPVAAVGAWLGPNAPQVMMGLGFLPAIVLSLYLARFADAGTGPLLFFIMVLASVGALFATTLALWGAFLSAGDLVVLLLLALLPVVIFLVRAYLDRRREALLHRPLLAELLLWSGIGLVVATAGGIVLAGSFTGAGASVGASTSLFSGSTYVTSAFLDYPNLANAAPWLTSGLPALFGLLGLLSGLFTLVPLIATGDLMRLRSGVIVAEECTKCRKAYLVLQGRGVGLCPTHRIPSARAPPSGAAVSVPPPGPSP